MRCLSLSVLALVLSFGAPLAASETEATAEASAAETFGETAEAASAEAVPHEATQVACHFTCENGNDGVLVCFGPEDVCRSMITWQNCAGAGVKHLDCDPPAASASQATAQ